MTCDEGVVSTTPELALDVDELRRRVREEPGSRLFLGLAEELLRRGEREEALGVLEAGLAARPGQVAATVAKARCLIELERPLEAWEAIEAVLGAIPPIWWRRSSRSSCGCGWAISGGHARASSATHRWGPPIPT